ncbi:hypothetical protein HYH02_004032 [Chlamydomonas schloesseri]|uniref:EF-hand domain-containing protein n=1 Tax=Chlamydomonas schloesseri TaxID=2026947 RepID=A0A836B9Q9_9CHLO|nr:hypothetical protein HYH02_004032 [Chlamydomonas schloesseri]|eukprot:KAG2451434.1 hypothetical protein HYH02_004032 [Chlamydomonas schloesseri]
MAISIAWQIFIALITFLNSFYGGAKTIWLTRLKEEVLDVGVISLVLVFVYPYIAGICVDSSSSSYPSVASKYPLPPSSAPPPLPAPPSLPRSLLAAGARAVLASSLDGVASADRDEAGAIAGVGLAHDDGASLGFAAGAGGRRRGLAEQLATGLVLAVRRALAGGGSAAACPEGQRHLFPAGSISNAHYLLFFVALVHIVYSLFTFTLTLQRFTFWSKWERRARLEAMDAAEVLESPEDEDGAKKKRRCWGLCCTGCCACCGTRDRPPTWYCRPFVHGLRYLQGGIDRDRYMVLRGLFQLRSRAHRVKAFVDNLHYTNVCENAMEIDIAKMVAHGWLQALIVAIFTLYPTVVYQILWIGGASILIQVIVVAKMESVVSKVLRIVRVAGSQAAPVYHINTAAEEYQELTDTSFDDEEDLPLSSSSSSSSEDWDYHKRQQGPSEGRAGSEHSRRAFTMRVPEPLPMAGAEVLVPRKFQSMDMRAADYSLPSSYQHTHVNGHHHGHLHGDEAGPWQGQGQGVQQGNDQQHSGMVPMPRRRSSKRLEAAGGGGNSGRDGGGVMSPPAQQELPRRRRSGGPVGEAREEGAGEEEASSRYCTPRGWMQTRRHGGLGGAGSSRRRRTGALGFMAGQEAEDDGGVFADTEGLMVGSSSGSSSSGSSSREEEDAQAGAATRAGGGGGCSSSGGSGSWWAPAGAHGRSSRRHCGRARRSQAWREHRCQHGPQGQAGVGPASFPGPVAEARDRSGVDRDPASGSRGNPSPVGGGGAASGTASTSSLKNRSVTGALPVGGLTASVALKASNSGLRTSSTGTAPAAGNVRISGAGRGVVSRSESGPMLDDGGVPGSAGSGADVFRAARNPLYDLEHLDADMEPELVAAAGGARTANGVGTASDALSLDAALWAFTEDGEARGSNTSATGMVRMQSAAATATAAAATAAAAAAAASRRAGGGAGTNPTLETMGSGQGGSQRAAGLAPLAPASSARGAAANAEGGAAKYANPLFREGSMVSTSFTAAARVAALAAARNVSSGRTTAPLEPGGGIDAAAVMAAGGQDPAAADADAAAAEQRLREGPALKWKGPAVSGEAAAAAANGPSRAGGPWGLGKVFNMRRSGTGARAAQAADASGSGNAGVAPAAAAAAGAAVATGAAVAAASAAGAGREAGVPLPQLPAAASGPAWGYGPSSGASGGPSPQSQRRAASATSGVSYVQSQQQPPPRAPSPLARTATGQVNSTRPGDRVPGRISASASGAHPAYVSAAAAGSRPHHQHNSSIAGSAASAASASGGQLPASATPRSLAAAYAAAGGGRGGSVTGRYSSLTGGAAAAAAAYGVHPSGGSVDGPPPTPGSMHVPKAAIAAYDVGLLNAGVAEVDMALVQRKLRALFWFRRPQILIWISHVNFLQNSLSLTLCIYYLFSYDTGNSILQVSSRLLYVWLPLLGANLAFMVYMGWVVVPLYTLVSTTCVRNPRALQSHIRRHKKAEAEEEGGITGFVLELLTRCFMRSHHHTTRMAAKHGGSETTALNNLFMANLANQAGVIMASDAQLTNKKMGAAEAVYRAYIDIWRAKVRIAAGLEAPPEEGFKLQADVSEFRSAFNALDADGSSTVTTDELFTHLHVLGTRATKTELKSMISQIDNDGDKRVDFDEFVVFMVFAFFDENGNSCVEIPDIRKMCRRVKLQVADEEVSAMMDLADPDGDRKIGLRQFFKLFKDVAIPELGPRPANAELHGMVLPTANVNAAAAGGGAPSRSATSRAYRGAHLASPPPFGSSGSMSMGHGGGGGGGSAGARSRLARATAVDPAEGGTSPPPRRAGSGSRKGLRPGSGSRKALPNGSTGGSESTGGSPTVSGKGGAFPAGGLAAAAAAAAANGLSAGSPANDGSALLPEQLSPLRRGASHQQQQQQQHPTRGAAEIVATSVFGDEHGNGQGADVPATGAGAGNDHPELAHQGSKYRQLRVSLQ